MNLNKFLTQATIEGIEVAEITYSSEKNLSFSLFNHEIDNYTTSKQSYISARGVYNGKLGYSTTEEEGNKSISYLIENIKNTATYIEKEETPIIFKGSKKYKKKNIFNKELSSVPIDVKLSKLHELEDIIYKLDSRINKVEVSYTENENEFILQNSYGLKLKSKSNLYYYYASVVAVDGQEIKSDYEIFLDNDFTKFNPKEIAEKVVKKTLSKFNGTSIKSSSYKAVLNPEVTGTFINALINTSCNAENIQMKSSLFVDKLNKSVISSKITIEERPLAQNCFFSYFDSEGVATYNKKIIEKGVLKTYLYNLETAKKDNVESTGNASKQGSKMGIGSVNLYLKPGSYTEENLFKKVGNGVYITSITGLHAGLNSNSGDFSLEAEGYTIKDGKVDKPLELITIGGNILTLFNDVSAVANNTELLLNSTSASSILIKNLNISAE